LIFLFAYVSTITKNKSIQLASDLWFSISTGLLFLTLAADYVPCKDKDTTIALLRKTFTPEAFCSKDKTKAMFVQLKWWCVTINSFDLLPTIAKILLPLRVCWVMSILNFNKEISWNKISYDWSTVVKTRSQNTNVIAQHVSTYFPGQTPGFHVAVLTVKCFVLSCSCSPIMTSLKLYIISTSSFTSCSISANCLMEQARCKVSHTKLCL